MARRTDLKIPYGVADFKRIRTEGYYYVDKTEYLAKMEERDSFVFFVRPRRFGKMLALDFSKVGKGADAPLDQKFDIYLSTVLDMLLEANGDLFDAGFVGECKKLPVSAKFDRVIDLAKDTTLHLILFQFRGFDLHRIEEIPQ